MNKRTRVSHPIYDLLPAEIDGFDLLAELALDLHWTWNHATDEVWRYLDPVLWDLTHHPCDVLQTASQEKIRQLLADPTSAKESMRLCGPSGWQRKRPPGFRRIIPRRP